uniref:DNA_MISMATCH_REPAIR_2 domain-containing protein n=1 Tax=Steinernema glaseri TaxID=37863 RepID=A0A1I7Y7V4_9BILA
MSEVILALCYGGGKIGAAYYEEDIKTIRILHDVSEEGDFSVLVSLLEQVNPTQVLACSAQDISLLAFLNQICESEDEDKEDQSTTQESGAEEQVEEDTTEVAVVPNDDEDYENPHMKLHLLPKTEYRYEDAQKRIQLLFLGESSSVAESKLITSFRVDLSYENMIRSFGALLKYMDRNRIGVEYEHVDVKTPVSSIKVFTIEGMLDIDRTTFAALQIFQSDYHPSAGKLASSFKSSTKEGVSIFRICNRCRSVPGKKLLRRWFERPTTNKSILISRQQAISYFIQDCNMEVTQFLYAKLKHIKSLRGILTRIRGGTVSTNDWKNLYLTCCHMVQISEFLKGRQVKLDILDELLPFCNEKLVSTTAMLAEIIDFEASAKEDRFVVAKGVDAELDKSKAIHEQLPEILTRIAVEECRNLDIVSCSVGYIPVIGFLLSVPVGVSIPEGQDLDMVYCTDEVVNFKSPRMQELDSQIGDIKPIIMDMERTIMLRIQAKVNERSGAILRAVHVMAVIESLISLTIAAREYNWTRPLLVDQPIIDVDGARHPISELMSEKPFVANPIKSGGESSKVKLLTGPNASGKSVYLKMVGIIAYMAHIGSFVPADRAVMGPINRILTRMYTIDNVLDGMSTFAKDLNQMSIALRRSNGFSLVIIDEFGKGTITEVGLSILACTLNYWLAKGKQGCPHIYASSHFHALPELLEYNGNILTYHTLEVVKHGERLEFLYKLVNGMIDCSYASYTAAQVGMDKAIVSRADEVYNLLRSGKTLEHVLPCDYDEQEVNGEMARQMEYLLSDFMSWDLDEDPKGFLELSRSVLSAEPNFNETCSIGSPAYSVDFCARQRATQLANATQQRREAFSELSREASTRSREPEVSFGTTQDLPVRLSRAASSGQGQRIHDASSTPIPATSSRREASSEQRDRAQPSFGQTQEAAPGQVDQGFSFTLTQGAFPGAMREFSFGLSQENSQVGTNREFSFELSQEASSTPIRAFSFGLSQDGSLGPSSPFSFQLTQEEASVGSLAQKASQARSVPEDSDIVPETQIS